MAEDEIKELREQLQGMAEALAANKKLLESVAVTQTNSMLLFHQQQHEKKLEIIRNKRRRGEKIKVFFLNATLSKFPEKSIYDHMVRSDVFDPYIFIVARNTSDHKVIRENYEVFLRRGYKVIYGYDRNEAAIGLDVFQPDLVFFNESPTFRGEYRVDLMQYRYLTCYVPYGMSVAKSDKYQFENNALNMSWKNFAAIGQVYTAFFNSKLTPYNAVHFGYPKIDAYMKPLEETVIDKKIDNGKPIVIYAPHWTIQKCGSLATFDLYYEFFFSLLEENRDINFVFKPHPELRKRIAVLEKDGVLETLSVAKYDEYFEKWNAAPNGLCVTDGEYIDLFRRSECLITDSGSFVAEWLPTGRPCIFLYPPENKNYERWFRPFAQRILETYYPAGTQAEIRQHFERIIGGQDEKKKKRAELSKALFTNLGCAGAEIVRYLTAQVSGGSE